MAASPNDRLKKLFADRILDANTNFGDHEVVVAPKDWLEVAQALRDDAELAMNHFIDLTAVDYPLRAPEPRFDVILIVRSTTNNGRVKVKTRVAEGASLASVYTVWPGANWAEREVFDMFGVTFAEHPDLRRILLYEEFVGYPLRKDYPIQKTQPLMPYREVPDIEKLPPFGDDEGAPFSRVDWRERIEGRDFQVSPAIGVQQQQRPALSQGSEYTDRDDEAVRHAEK